MQITQCADHLTNSLLVNYDMFCEPKFQCCELCIIHGITNGWLWYWGERSIEIGLCRNVKLLLTNQAIS